MKNSQLQTHMRIVAHLFSSPISTWAQPVLIYSISINTNTYTHNGNPIQTLKDHCNFAPKMNEYNKTFLRHTNFLHNQKIIQKKSWET